MTPCRQEFWCFQLSVGGKASLVESQQMSSFVFISFHRLSFCIHFLSCSFRFALISFHFAFMSFHVPSLCIKDTGLRKLICSNLSGAYPPKRSRFFIFRDCFCYRLAIVLEACADCHLQASWTCTCISSLSFFYSYRFLGRQCIDSVKVQAKPKWNARGYYPTWFLIMFRRLDTVPIPTVSHRWPWNRGTVASRGSEQFPSRRLPASDGTRRSGRGISSLGSHLVTS